MKTKQKLTITKKSALMVYHLHVVEALLGRRITPAELTSATFTQSRDEFLAWVLKNLEPKWKGA